MRIAVACPLRQKVGGVESYLSNIIPQLNKLGHELAFLCENDSDSDLEKIFLPRHVPAWCVAEIGPETALKELQQWRPDLIYSQGLSNEHLETELLKIAPAVVFLHGYYGTCISGTKTTRRPTPAPCDRRFGPKCLLNYHVRGCGGLNPVTMLKEYSRQSARLRSLQKYSAIITASDFMRREFIRNGITAEKVFRVSLPLSAAHPETDLTGFAENEAENGGAVTSEGARRSRSGNGMEANFRKQWRLLFLGRMTRLKGGEVLLDALPKVRAILDKPLRVTFAGDGPERLTWQRKAEETQGRYEGLEINFPGWLSGNGLEEALIGSDLLIVPSLWPEPFGLVGPEAGSCGVPAAAFDVGGIRDWLSDGANGFLAPGNPPTSKGLAAAIVKCLADANTYARLRAGALELAARFSMQNHLAALLEVFWSVAGRDFQAAGAALASSATPAIP